MGQSLSRFSGRFSRFLAIGASVFLSVSAHAEGRRFHVGDKLEYGHSLTVLHVYGVTDPTFDERAGRPVDTKGQSVDLRWTFSTSIIIEDLRQAPDGSDGWYLILMKAGWDTQYPSRVWIRAADLQGLTEDALTHVEFVQKPTRSADSIREDQAAALTSEAEDSTPEYRTKWEAEYERVYNHPRIYKSGQICEVNTRTNQASFIAVRSAPSVSSKLLGFLDWHSFVQLQSLTADGWWRVSISLDNGTRPSAYIPEWFVGPCGDATPYAKARRFTLHPPVG